MRSWGSEKLVVKALQIFKILRWKIIHCPTTLVLAALGFLKIELFFLIRDKHSVPTEVSKMDVWIHLVAWQYATQNLLKVNCNWARAKKLIISKVFQHKMSPNNNIIFQAWFSLHSLKSYHNFSGSCMIPVFTKPDSLPSSKIKFSIGDWNCHTWPNKCSFYMSCKGKCCAVWLKLQCKENA